MIVGVTATWKNFAPRLGAAYRFSDKTVVRAGFGTSDHSVPEQLATPSTSRSSRTNQFTDAQSSLPAAGSMAAGFPAPTVFDVPDNGII